jgi:dienelactone hydrolase
VALELARAGADLKGVATFHGNLATRLPAKKGEVKAPLLVMNGADDSFVPKAQIDGFQDEMRAASADWQFVQLSKSVHCFAEPDEHGALPGCVFNPVAYKRSVRMMNDFFRESFAKK